MPGRSYKPAPPTFTSPVPGGGSAASPIKVYEHTFNSPYNYPYTVAPPTISGYLTTTGWTNSQLSWSGSNGIIYLPGSGSQPSTIILTLNVQSGYGLSITSFSILCKSMNNGYRNWSMTINGITVGSGTVNVGNGAAYSTVGGNVTNPVNGLTGTVIVVITLSNATGNGQFRMDNFVLNGYVEQLTSGAISAKDYRYGFNGQEKSTEIDPNGSSYTAEFWQYDARIGRRWNLDPKPTIGVSSYSTFLNNPIWYSDIKGDSIGPNRKTPVNVFIVPIEKDKVLKMDYSRLQDTKGKYKTYILHTNSLNEDAAAKVKEFLGEDRYINNMVIDYHRTEYDEMKKEGKDEFYTSLSKGFSGSKTTVLLGMCWAGGAEINAKEFRANLTIGISQKLDKATVYGLKTEANSVSFKLSGNFGVLNPAYLSGNNDWSRHERAFESEWTVSRYDNASKKYTQDDIYKAVRLTLQGDILIKPIKITSTDIPFR